MPPTHTHICDTYIHETSPEGNTRNWLIWLSLKWKTVELGTTSEWGLHIFCIPFKHLESLPGAYILSKIKTIKNTIKCNKSLYLYPPIQFRAP